MILAAIIIAKNPAQYGFDFEADPPLAYETVTLRKPVDLRRVAEWTGATIDEIQALNPELRRWTTPVRDTAYELKVPVGTARLVNRATDRDGHGRARVAEVVHGEEGRNARRPSPGSSSVSRTDLAEANYLTTTAKLTRRPEAHRAARRPSVLMAAQTERPVPAADRARRARRGRTAPWPAARGPRNGSRSSIR